MKRTILAALAVVLTLSAGAAEKKDSVNPNKPVFTVIKQNPITSIKNQNRSGTCWDFSTLSFFEAEILKNTGKTYDLCEAFVANKTYMDRAIQVVRLHGDCQFAEGGSCYDPLYCIQHYGIVPETAMPKAGSQYGDSLFNFNEFFKVMTPYVEAVAKSNATKLSPAWKNGLQGILDSYLGKCPTSFTYQGKTYTPKSFAASIGLDSAACNNYVSFTSYTHHPFWTSFAVEVQDNWRNRIDLERTYRRPLEDH
jgi:aminopeptidase C